MSQHPVYVRAGSGDFYEGLAFRYKAYWAAQGANVAGSPAFQVARDGRLGSRLVATNYNNFAPRLGIAWSPSDKWSIRTGFGIFYSQESKNSIFDLNRGLGGRTGQVAPTTYGTPTFGYTNFIDTSALPVTIAGWTYLGSGPHPADHLQHDVPAEHPAHARQEHHAGVGYNGSESRHLANLINAGAPIPGTSSVLTRLPYPEFGAAGIQFLKNDGAGNYNGLGTKVSQRFGNNMTGLFSYTWSKALDDSSAIRGPGNDFVAENARCRRCDYGYSTFDVPHRFVGVGALQSAVRKGQRFLESRRVREPGGWWVATQHHHHSAKRIDDGDQFMGFGWRSLLA